MRDLKAYPLFVIVCAVLAWLVYRWGMSQGPKSVTSAGVPAPFSSANVPGAGAPAIPSSPNLSFPQPPVLIAPKTVQPAPMQLPGRRADTAQAKTPDDSSRK